MNELIQSLNLTAFVPLGSRTDYEGTPTSDFTFDHGHRLDCCLLH